MSDLTDQEISELSDRVGDLCGSLKQRCRDNIDALDVDSLVELAETLIDLNDPEVVELRQLLQVETE